MDIQEQKISKPKKEKPRAARYFDVSTGESETLEKIKLNPKKQQNFHGDKITLKEEKPFKRKAQIFKIQKEKKRKIPKELLQKYSRGAKVQNGIKTKFFKEKLKRKEEHLEYAVEQAARTEILLKEGAGFIVPEENERTMDFRQKEIAANVDITTAAKIFKLNLDFGPYSMQYTKNGRYLLLGGRKGHVAAFDWVTKHLKCEMNVMEEVADVAWLHVETMFACAQKNWVYIYDSHGTELHCIKQLYQVNRMEFLPYHFLLACASNQGFASWLDVSIGEIVGHYNTKLGDIRVMRQNLTNGVVCIGGGKGVVSMWSPKSRHPLAQILCHPAPISSICVDPKGQHLVTSGLDKYVKVWDVRQLSGPMEAYKLKLPANQLDVSQRGLLAVSTGNFCHIYPNVLVGNDMQPYLRHKADGFISGLRFCPYEDILGMSTANGFQSLIVPGAGEPNFDAFEDNPFQSRSQRKEHEVHALLEKIPAELISLNPNDILAVDVPTLEEKVDAKKALFFLKPPKVDFTSRYKMKGRGGSAKAARNKQIVRAMARKEFIADIRQQKKKVIAEAKVETLNDTEVESNSKPTALDRFKPKKKK